MSLLDAYIVYYIVVSADAATRNPFSTVTRYATNQGKPRIAMRETVVQKKEKRNKITPFRRPDAKDPLASMLRFAIEYQTAFPVYYTLHSLQDDCVLSC